MWCHSLGSHGCVSVCVSPPPHHLTPVCRCRLLGPSAAADILQLSNSLPLQSRGRTRLLVGNEDVHIIARSDDELLDDFFHEQSSTGGQAGKDHTKRTSLIAPHLHPDQLWWNTSAGLQLNCRHCSVFVHGVHRLSLLSLLPSPPFSPSLRHTLQYSYRLNPLDRRV